jgi:quercetin dioxygenase-like cupin family protein
MASDSGITRGGESLDGVVWDVMGQTYKPVQLTAASFAFDTLFPPGTFVPPHIHPDQDEFIRVLEGRFDLWLDGADLTASAGDLVRLPQGSKHGIFNRSGAVTRALFWVAPARQLYDLFVQLDGLRDPPEVVRRSAACNIHFLPPDQWPSARYLPGPA